MKRHKLRLGLFLLVGSSVVHAQAPAYTRATTSSHVPVTARDGRIIVAAAWERDQDQREDQKPDCSHLAHDVYALAGYPYPYARSIDLYAGIGNFVRVAKPQAGDLIVWRGHVGIVVAPSEHTFYSSVSSGVRIENYDAPAWKARGTARFYRYAAVKRAHLVLAGNRGPQAPRAATAVIPPVTTAEGSLERPPDSTHASATRSAFSNTAVASPEPSSIRSAFAVRSGSSN